MKGTPVSNKDYDALDPVFLVQLPAIFYNESVSLLTSYGREILEPA